MSDLLATGQVIDQLKPNEIAEADGFPNLRLQYRDIGLVYIDEEGLTDREKGVSGHFFINGDFIKNLKWRILPGYVSFEEAMEAFSDGKRIYLEDFTGNIHSFHESERYDLGGLDLKEINSTKWTIED